jgi:transcription initiation factor TFIIF subunit alpha
MLSLKLLSFCFWHRFGAGSEFGRDAREEARRKKFGIVSRKYRPEDQPWILKIGGKTGKK